MSLYDKIDDVDLDSLDQNYRQSTQSDYNNLLQGDFISRFWRFLTGKYEQNNSTHILT